LWTPPLHELTPETSYGFSVIEFARDVLGHPLDPWQEWVAIHACELLPDGRPRFRTILILVARQNGKTELLVILTLFWLYVELTGMVLGTSTKLDYAKESWLKAVALARSIPDLADEIPKRGGVRQANGETQLMLATGGRYKIAPANAEGGRSLSVDRLVMDELRQHHTWEAWNATKNTMNARPYGQCWATSNAGDDTSVVLNSLRESALQFIESGEGDRRLGLFEYSAPDGADVCDPIAQATANPNYGRRIDPDSIMGDAIRAKAAGGEELAGFRTEILCQRVKMLDPAIDPAAWATCCDPGDLTQARGRLALCVDVSLDAQHASVLAAAVLPDGRVRVEVVGAWSGPNAAADLRRGIGPLVARVRPQVLGWLPGGPAAAVAADLADRKKAGRMSWPPPGVRVEEIRAEVTACCMGLASLVTAGQVAHSNDPLLNAHVTGAERMHQGDAWRFTRKGAGHCDATYALAGAVHLARTLPSPVGGIRIVTAGPLPLRRGRD
jgi:hypothetical protein